MPEFMSDGLRIFFVEEGKGEILFLVHGLGESHETWKEQISFFSKEGFKVVALDLRGHGKSEIPKKRIEIEDFAMDVINLAAFRGMDKVNFCGYSMGAVVLFEVYRLKPELFKTFIIEAAVPQYPPAQTSLLENMNMDEIARQVADFAVSPLAPEKLREDIYQIIRKTDKEIYIESAEAACSKNYTSLLPNIRVPTLIVSGELDYISPPEAARQMAEQIPDARVVIFKKTGHMPHREKAEDFNAEVLKFLRG